MQRNRNSPAKIARIERRRRAVELLSTGVSQTAVAREIGVSQSCVSKDLARVVEEDRALAVDAVREMRARELSTLELMEGAAAERFERADDDGTCIKWGDHRLRVMERRARLVGLDAPSKTAVVASVGVENSQTDFIGDAGEQIVARVLDELAAVGIDGAAAGAILAALGVAADDLKYAERIRAGRDAVDGGATT